MRYAVLALLFLAAAAGAADDAAPAPVRPPAKILILVWEGKSPLPDGPLFDRRGNLVCYATGAVPPPSPIFDLAFVTMVVQPKPGPAPVVTPTPAPVAAVTVPLYAVLAYDLNDPNGRALAPVRADPALAPALKSLGVDWHAWDFANPAWDGLNLRAVVGAAGPPVLVVYDAAGNTYGPDGAVVPRSKAAFPPPAASDAVVAMFRKMRGQ